MSNIPPPQPPNWAKQLLEWFCKPELLEYILGDLEESFEEQVNQDGIKKANRKFILEVFGLFRFGIIRNFSFSNHLTSLTMLINYFKIAFRQVKKYKLFASLNIMGLATSMSVCLLIIMILSDQYSYDLFHEKKNRIFRVISSLEDQPPSNARFATAPSFLGEELKNNHPFIEESVRMIWPGETLIYKNKKLDANGPWVDPAFLNIFSFGWLKGDATTALKDPYSIVITQKLVDRYFSDKNPIGEIITISDVGDFEIKGVMPDVPRRSHMQFEYLISSSTINSLDRDKEKSIKWKDWDTIYRMSYVYLLLKDHVNQSDTDEALAQIASTRNQEKESNFWYFESQNIASISPGNDLSNDQNASPKIIFQFLITLGIIIILFACFNYTNLSLARAIKRSKEIGIRKVVGAKRKQIIFQFVIEAIVISLLSLGFAVFILEFLVQSFYQMDPFVLEHFQLEKSWQNYSFFLLFSIIIGIIAGLLPAWRLSSFRPIQVLKNLKTLKTFSKVTLRKALTVFQFGFSVIFIITTITVLKQKNYILNTDLGLNTENLLNVHLQDTDYAKFKEQFQQLPEVQEISAVSAVPMIGEVNFSNIYFNNRQDSMQISENFVTPNWLDNMGIKLIAGESFPKNASSQNEQFAIINNLAAQRFGYSNVKDALGQIIETKDAAITIIGVVKDYHHENIWDAPITPHLLRYNPKKLDTANIRISAIDQATAIRKISSKWELIHPEKSFTAFFLDERIYYRAKFFKMGSKIIGLVGFLAIIIACLGLLGIVTYTVEDKAKEVGIRKVLGASEHNLVWFLSKNFLLLIGISLLIAVPASWLLNNFWLQNFSQRITVSPSILLSGAGLILLLSLITVISKTWYAAKSNPSGLLRSE